MKTAEKEKWLGQQIAAGGLADSVAETVNAKEGKIKAACLERILSMTGEQRQLVDWNQQSSYGKLV